MYGGISSVSQQYNSLLTASAEGMKVGPGRQIDRKYIDANSNCESGLFS